uniref:Tyr recombinase domain-containing protein n=1 Tax=Trichogramma kaykai TaxID=54128 RepID=A0ABD2WE08_9HYME
MFVINSSHPPDSDSDSESESETEEETNVAKELKELIEKARSNVIPEKSKSLYEAQYTKFKSWCSEMKLGNEISQDILLAYFQKLSETYAPTTLWATYTKIKAMVSCKENKDISKFLELHAFLKSKSKKHIVKKSKVFTPDEISKFLNEAPDTENLLHKVVLVIGLHGCLRTAELLAIQIQDIKEEGTLYHITIPHTKTGISKSFVTCAEVHQLITKYIKLRPEGMQRFFVQYRNQACTRQNVGKGKLSKIPKDIATFLKLPDSQKYTGHALRRTSATLAADRGADLLTLKRLGGWKSSTVAESYINESIMNKKAASELIGSNFNFKNKTTKREALDKNVNAPSTSKYKNQDIFDEDLDMIMSITQEDYQDILETEFSKEKNVVPDIQPKKCMQPLKVNSNSKKISTVVNTRTLTQEELDECELTQEEIQELFSTENDFNNKKRKMCEQTEDDKENSPLANLFNKKKKSKPSIYIQKLSFYHKQ